MKGKHYKQTVFMMEKILILILIVLTLYIIADKLKNKRSKQSHTQKPETEPPKEISINDNFFPYYKKMYFFTIPERKFFEILIKITADTNLHVFPHVRLWDTIDVWSKYRDNPIYQNSIKARHVDFLITKSPYHEPVLIIELDGPSHKTDYNTILSDYIKNGAFKTAKLPLMRVEQKADESDYDIISIKKDISSYTDICLPACKLNLETGSETTFDISSLSEESNEDLKKYIELLKIKDMRDKSDGETS